MAEQEAQYKALTREEPNRRVVQEPDIFFSDADDVTGCHGRAPGEATVG